MLTTATICDCCGERDAHPLCAGYCAECARPATCACCERELSEDDACGWSPASQVECQCERCRKIDNEQAMMIELRDAAIAVAESAGWTVEIADTGRRGSWYYELERAVGDEVEHLKLRIADHGTAYCSEDVSLVIDSRGTPDDHTMDDWRKAVA